MSLRILLLGKNGQVGWELQRSLAVLGEVVALDRRGHDGLSGDLADLEGLRRAVRTLRPQVIVNAAAHTAVDQAESEPDLSHLLNAQAPRVLAKEARALDAWLVHYSTDYVFDGSGSHARSEQEATGPLSVYGRTKLEGEQAIQASGCKHLIFRTSWVYAARGGNFAKTMLRLAQERERLTVIDDQWGAPTGADLIADITAHALVQALHDPGKSGLYHLVAAGETTWHAYANFVIAQAQKISAELQVKATDISAVPTASFPTPAVRPANSRLDTRALQGVFDLVLPPWQQGVTRMLREIL